MRIILTASILLAFFFACNEKKTTIQKPIVKDSTIHNTDTIKHFFAKRYGLPRG